MPILAAAIPAAVGLYQTISGGIKAHKAQKALEGMKTPGYAPNKAINDYYQSALNQYNQNPYNTAGYQYAKKGAGAAFAGGLSALRDRRTAAGNVGALSQMYNNNLQQAGAVAEGRRSQALRMLGHAASAKAGEDRQAFNINDMLPYQQNYQLGVSKLSGANQVLNAGISNIGSAFNNLGEMAYANQANGGNPVSLWGGLGRRRQTGIGGGGTRLYNQDGSQIVY